MTSETITKLAALNKRFYEEQGESFNQTRQTFWPGWTLLLPLLKKYQAGLTLADLGCGNGRLLDFLLEEKVSQKLTYFGIDGSQVLTDILKLKKLNWYGDLNVNYMQWDIVTALLESRSFDEVLWDSFDIIALIAVLHHIPSYRLREKLFSQIGMHLKADGSFIFTTWQFLDVPNLKQKIVSPHQAGIDESELEPGDYILDWQKQTTGYRYCHYFEESEILKLLESANLKLTEKYFADGASQQANCYYVVTH